MLSIRNLVVFAIALAQAIFLTGAAAQVSERHTSRGPAHAKLSEDTRTPATRANRGGAPMVVDADAEPQDMIVQYTGDVQDQDVEQARRAGAEVRGVNR